jgi:hypothetical protein
MGEMYAASCKIQATLLNSHVGLRFYFGPGFEVVSVWKLAILNTQIVIEACTLFVSF